MNRILLALIACGIAPLLVATPVAWGVAESPSGPVTFTDDGDDRAPLKVTADRMVSDQAKGVIEFSGSVDAVKGSLHVVADKIFVFTDEAQNDFSHIKAIGSVRILKGNKRATGETADYLRAENTIILTGSPTLDDGKSEARGEKVIYNFKTEEMTLLGGATVNGEPGRATVTLFADNDNNIVTGETPTPQTTSTPSPLARYTVQVGAFREGKDARRFAKKLVDKGYVTARVLTDESGEKIVHRVRVGRFSTKEEANTLVERLRADENIDGFTLSCEKRCD